MASVLQDYDFKYFNSIPNLHDATVRWNAKRGYNFVKNTFQPLVLKHGLEGTFGIGLLHQHYQLAESEKVVEFNNVSTPWKINTPSLDLLKGRVLPCGWLLTPSGHLMPYEFYFMPVGSEGVVIDFSSDNVRRFAEEFVASARGQSFDQVIALRLFHHGENFKGQLEITQGRANINFVPGQYDEINLSRYSAEVMWFFNNLAKPAKCCCVIYIGDPHAHGVYNPGT